MTMPAGLYTIKEAAQLCGRDVSTLRRWVAQGILVPAFVDDRTHLYASGALQRACEQVSK
jgi:DNA-binding transcriptional MerR regulator